MDSTRLSRTATSICNRRTFCIARGPSGLVPVGLMWGNDPGLTARDVNSGKRPKESIINPSAELPLFDVQSPRQHLGWAGRLNGPVDNPMSSCLSCHATAQWPAKSAMTPSGRFKPGGPEWMRWFTNVKAGQPFDAGAESLDYSLQLAVGIQNFDEWKKMVDSMGGFSVPGQPPRRGWFSARPASAVPPSPTVHEVSRDEKDDPPEDDTEGKR